MTIRTLHIVISGMALILLSPVFAVLSVLIICKLGHPMLFAQVRPGLAAVPFRMYKFRSMTNARDVQGHLLPDSARLPPFGVWLRATSMDELPSLWNVLVGDMSLVGPRPLLMQYLPLYSENQARRHLLRPGLTGWAQVNGRNAISWEEKFELDVWYVDHRSFWLDIKILWLTVIKVINRDGISADDDATMPRFEGTK